MFLMPIDALPASTALSTDAACECRVEQIVKSRVVESRPSGLSCSALSPDQQSIAIGDTNGCLWILQRSRPGMAQHRLHSAPIRSLAWSPRGSVVASSSDDLAVQLLYPDDGQKVRTLRGHKACAWAVAWSPDGTLLASGADDGVIYIWEPESGRILITIEAHREWIWSVAWSADGRRLASASEDYTVAIWELPAGTLVDRLTGNRGGVRTLKWSPRGVLAWGSDDSTVGLWDPSSGNARRVLQGHPSAVVQLAWSADAAMLASSSQDCSLCVWESSTSRLLFRAPSLSSIEYPLALAFGASSEFDARIGTGRIRSRISICEAVQPKVNMSQRLKLFLCHCSGDKPQVRLLYARLRQDGFEPWLDEEDILPGQDWQAEIMKAVRGSDVILVCLSARAINKAGFVQKEIKYALDAADEQPEGEIFIVPVQIESCDVPERLRRWQWVELFDQSGYGKLLRALNARSASLLSRRQRSDQA
jgi:hypothetical protein